MNWLGLICVDGDEGERLRPLAVIVEEDELVGGPTTLLA